MKITRDQLSKLILKEINMISERVTAEDNAAHLADLKEFTLEYFNEDKTPKQIILDYNAAQTALIDSMKETAKRIDEKSKAPQLYYSILKDVEEGWSKVMNAEESIAKTLFRS